MSPARDAAPAARPAITFVHPLDPWHPGVGGFDTTFAGLASAARERWAIEVIGVTADRDARPPGRWLERPWRGRPLRFFAALEEPEPDGIRRLPLSLRFAAACRARRLRAGGTIVQLLRFESALAVPSRASQRTVLCLLNDLTSALRPPRDLRWRYAPGLFRRLLLWQLRRTDTVLAAAPTMAEELPRRLPELAGRVLRLREWIDTGVFSPGSPDERRRARSELRRALGLEPHATIVVTAGRMAVHKGHALLLDAFALYAAGKPSTALLMVGKGPERGRLVERARALGLGGRCRFHEPVPRPELARLYRGCDLAVCASERDAGPRLVFEALGCGLPVVSTRVGQAEELLGPAGEFGILLARRRREDLAAALREALRRPHGAAEIERLGRRAREFSSERVLAPVLARYQTILEATTPT